MYLDKALADASWVYINNLAVKNKNLDLKEILFSSNSVNKLTTKYQYTYGFYNIAPNLNDFEKTGVYVSSPISADGNIQSLSITTDETHPLTSEKTKATDIEYYISYSENPNAYDWKPILPKNIDIVEAELMQICGELFNLRFPATELYSVSINGIAMDPSSDYIVHRITDEESEFKDCIYAIDIPNVDPFSKYTVSYKPNSKCKSLILLEDMEGIFTANSLEVIEATNTSCYTLKNFPYVASNVDSITSIKITNKNSGAVITQDSGKIICVTNPYSSNESYKNFDNANSSIQYYTDKNNVYFNNNISDDFLIEINYNHYISSIRLKAIFRRTSLKGGWMTPVLDKIKYEFITID
jgi:hypothetical protein